MNKPTDQELYNKIKKKVYSDIPKNSAYRSGILVKKYKAAFLKRYGKKKKPYTGNKSKGTLTRWFKERWLNQRGKVGYSKPGDIYRPTKRISKKTPATFKELSKAQIKAAKKEKSKKGRVSKFKK